MEDLGNFRKLSFEDIRLKKDVKERFCIYYWVLLLIPSIGKLKTTFKKLFIFFSDILYKQWNEDDVSDSNDNNCRFDSAYSKSSSPNSEN